MHQPPPEDLAKAQAVIEQLRSQLHALFGRIPDDQECAVRFTPLGEDK